jgi:hypothetical protein
MRKRERQVMMDHFFMNFSKEGEEEGVHGEGEERARKQDGSKETKYHKSKNK